MVPCVQLQRTLNSLRILDTKASFVAFGYTHIHTPTDTPTHRNPFIPVYGVHWQKLVTSTKQWYYVKYFEIAAAAVATARGLSPLSFSPLLYQPGMSMSAECCGCCGCRLWGRVGGGLGIAAMWHVTAKRCWLRPSTFLVIVWHMTPSECVPASYS